MKSGCRLVAGLDEVGRGCLAGPVVAAAVILKPEAYCLRGRVAEIRDSKLLPPKVREELVAEIEPLALGIGVGVVPADHIDACNIVEATRMAMMAAVANLPVRPDHLLIDYLRLPACCIPQKSIVHGDSVCLSIAAASLVAKVFRDALMREQNRTFPGYGFASNKGYGTPEHIAALQRLGPSPIHRYSFVPVRTCTQQRSAGGLSPAPP